MKELSCPKCKNPLVLEGNVVSGNSKYLLFRCDVCDHKEMKCVGLVKNGL